MTDDTIRYGVTPRQLAPVRETHHKRNLSQDDRKKTADRSREAESGKFETVVCDPPSADGGSLFFDRRGRQSKSFL